MGKLIVLEGACDGIGKSTQLKILKERLINEGYDIVTHHFPSYNTPQAKGIEDYLSGKLGDPKSLDPFFVNELYAYDRKVTWDNLLKEKYDAGSLILLDRYTTSSLIYQAALIENIDERKKFIDKVCELEYEKNGIAKPDLVIFLTADYDLVKKMRNERASNEGVVNDIHESNDDFMRKVYDNALFVAKYLNFHEIKCDTLENMRDINEIGEEVYNVVRKRI